MLPILSPIDGLLDLNVQVNMEFVPGMMGARECRECAVLCMQA